MSLILIHRCEVCTESLARYKCPGCLVQTCSVPCVKKHKEDTECTGKRDRTAYVPLRDFSDLNLLSGKYKQTSLVSKILKKFNYNWHIFIGKLDFRQAQVFFGISFWCTIHVSDWLIRLICRLPIFRRGTSENWQRTEQSNKRSK